MKSLYFLSIILGIGFFVYLYFFNFDNLSETELVNSVLYWYIPVIFGIYGIMALRIKTKIGNEETHVIKYLFSGRDVVLTVLAILLAITGVLGILLLFIPLAIFKLKSDHYDFSVAFVGTLICLVLLWLFFNVLWPSL